MENNSDNVAEIEKYAFLLGSAIKNEDTDQFFSIYDSILPKDLPDNQLEEIKERARKVVDLPEGEFNNLVLKARHFSLAPAGTAMTCRRESPSKQWTQPGKEETEDERKTLFSYGNRFDTSSVHSTTKISTRSSESDTRKFDDDSGVCNSSKATNSICSLSDNDGSEDEGHGVSFDYYPPQIKIRSGCGLSLDYDEAHEVKSDHSSQDINSPRSDFSEGIEMTTFSSRDQDDDDDDEFKFRRDTVSYQDDFNTSGESEDENSYRHKYYNLGYRPLTKDVPEFKPSFESYSTSSLRSSDVDRGISFSSLKDGTSQYSRYSSYQYPQSSSSERVKIEKNSYKRGKTDPPFGRGPGHFGKVASSIDSLISKVPSDEVKNMPEGRKLAPMQKEDTKKKKRKKKKDDAATDENGNPIVETRGLNPVQYKQMRESPSVGGGTVAYQPSDNTYGTFQSSEQHGTRSYSSRDIESDTVSKLVRRRKKKQEKLEQQKAEDIENYKGDQTIDELIRFIGGQNDSNKKPKKNSSPNEDIPSKTQKSNKKNKDKKQKSPTASSSVEEVEVKGGTSAQPACLDKQSSEDNMGNSSGKAEVEIVENGDIDGIYPKSDSFTKSSLKQNDKIDIDKPAIFVDNDQSLKGVTCRGSVKEKEHSATNNKRDIVTSSNSESNKKKSEKPAKATKVEKSEMHATKSEEALKLDTNTNLPNNVSVKQKNAKNKKNKSLSPSLKVESEIPPAELNHQPLLDSFPTGETFVNDTFIFTDLEVPHVPKEDEFQIVGKKKKKVTKETGHQNHYLTNNVNSKSVRRQEERRPALSHSSNKAFVPSVVPTSTVESDARLRDLSPSAFPALSTNKGRQSLQEGRRNSTGDVPIPSGLNMLKSQDDSDLESVKSLPATQGSQIIDSVLSPRLSYAKMAAGPKVPDSSSSSEKRSSLDSGDSGDSELDHKKSVWKGSPTERRHSIGSSPEEMNKITGTQANVSTASVKAGSQEHIVTDVVMSLEKKVAAGTPATALGGAHSKAKSLEESTSVLNKEIASPGEANVTLNESPVQTKSAVSQSRSIGNAVNANIVENSQQVITGMQPCTNKPETNSTNSVNKYNSVTNSSVHKQETSKNKTSTNGANGRKQKSVIFLDKRVEETPGNLGISFGFEMENLIKLSKTDPEIIDQSEQIVEKSEFKTENENVQSVYDVSSVNSKSEPKDVNIVTDIVKSTSSSPSVICNHSNNTEKSNSSSSNNEILDPVKTVPLQIVRMNGIVAPQGHIANLSKDIKDTFSENTDNSGETVETEQAIPETEEKGVCVYYGENVVTLKKDIVVPSLNNGPTSYCGLVRFIEESDVSGNFNMADAAAFLNKEWEKVRQMQEKDPESVKVYQD